MDGDIGIGLNAELDGPISNIDHGDPEHAIESTGTADHNRFMASSGQHQHGELLFMVG
jgi:hypothetical protein